MRPLLTIDEYTTIVGAGVWKVEQTEFDAKLRLIQDINLHNALPEKLCDALNDDLTPLTPELETYTEEYVKRFIAYSLATLWVGDKQIKQTPSGLRVINEQFSNQAAVRDVAKLASNYGSTADMYKRKMVSRWIKVNFTFDNVNYPPQMNQTDYYLTAGYWDFYGYNGYYANSAWCYGLPFTNRQTNIGNITFITV